MSTHHAFFHLRFHECRKAVRFVASCMQENPVRRLVPQHSDSRGDPSMAGMVGKEKVSQFKGHPWHSVTSSIGLIPSTKIFVAGGGSHENKKGRGAVAEWAHVAHQPVQLVVEVDDKRGVRALFRELRSSAKQ